MRPDSGKPYYTAYDKRYQAIYRQGVDYWTAHPDELNAIVRSVDAFLDRYEIDEDAHIVEFGCGEGGVGVYLLEKGYRYTGIDVSPTAVGKAVERIMRYGDRGRILCADILQITSFSDEYFDAAIDVGCLHMLVVDVDRWRYLNNAWRMLKVDAPMLFCREALRDDAVDAPVESYEDWLAISRQDVVTPQMRNAWQNDRPWPIQLPCMASRTRSLVQYRAEMEESGFGWMGSRVSSTGMGLTFEVVKADDGRTIDEEA